MMYTLNTKEAKKLTRRYINIPAPAGMAPKWIMDILKMPHTLIAGTTGAGKSVLLHSIIDAILYGHPTARQMVLIDTKKTELYRYLHLPHTLIYADTPSDACSALETVCNIIESRNVRIRNGYPVSQMSDIYVLIDELGDLVLTDRRATALLSKIAMIGRSAQVHLIGCTQNPNRKILSPQIEGNCPVRVGLRCRNPIESRQIIGTADAVDLPMYGKALFVSPEYRDPQLVNVNMVDPTPVMNYWR